ncbi:MAG: hypothetical protein ACXACF_08930 [Candidatus Hermodarchaeia archaeon]|jgi:hypothetical protein
MLQILQDLESAIGGTAGLSPVVLLGPGLVCVIAGLFIWLGGLGFRNLLLPTAGAIIGAVCGFFIIGPNFISVLFSAALVAGIATILERLFIAILTAALAAAVAFVVLAGPHIEYAQEAATERPAETSAQRQTISVRESAEIMKDYIIDAGQKIKRAGLHMSMHYWAIIMVLTLIFIVAGFFLWRLAMALCCSVLGTILIFASMILLLLHKGSVPVSIICSKSSYYATAFIAMIAFGTIEQLLLCKHPKTHSGRRRRIHKSKEEPGQTKERWRTS